MIVTQGGSAGGWTLYAHEGKLKYCYCYFGIDTLHRGGTKPIPAGAHQVRMEFTYDGGGLGQGRRRHALLRRQGRRKGARRQTQPMAFSADEACDVGADTGSPASPDYGPTDNKFTGEIDWVQIDSARTATTT